MSFTNIPAMEEQQLFHYLSNFIFWVGKYESIINKLSNESAYQWGISLLVSILFIICKVYYQ